MGYLNNQDKIVAAMMALSTLGLFGAFCAVTVLGAKRALAETTQAVVAPQASTGPSAGSIGALVVGGVSLSLTRRLLSR